MKKIIILTFTVISLPLITTTQAHAESLNTLLIQCHKVAQENKRLACYDQLASSLSSKPSKETNAQLNGEAEKRQASANDQVTLSKKESFGKTKTELDELESISTNIVGEFKGWKKGAIITLSNGQKWQVKSQNAGYVKLTNPKVTVSKGFWGSFNMQVEGLNAKAKVKRIQ